jgi:plastocyanin
MRSLRRAAPLVVLFAALLFLGACGKADDANDSGGATISTAIEAYDFYFQPTTISADMGGTVKVEFTNNGENTHSFTAPDLDISTEVQSGESAEITFASPETPGTYDFYCKFHPEDMKGVISVGGADQPVDESEDGTEDDGSEPTDTSTEDSGY